MFALFKFGILLDTSSLEVNLEAALAPTETVEAVSELRTDAQVLLVADGTLEFLEVEKVRGNFYLN